MNEETMTAKQAAKHIGGKVVKGLMRGVKYGVITAGITCLIVGACTAAKVTADA